MGRVTQMEQLEQLYNLRLKRTAFAPRKRVPDRDRLAISGPPGSGKTHLLLESCRRHEGGYLYIDLQDERLDLARLAQDLPEFITQKAITLLAIDGYDGRFVLPHHPARQQIVLAGGITAPVGFAHHRLWPLDFEEFLAFAKRADDPEGQFGEYLRLGGLPEGIWLDELHRLTRWQERLRLMLPDELSRAVYGFYLDRSGFSLTPHQAYTALKAQMKISKDKLYRLSRELIESNLLIAIAKYENPDAARKLFGYDFALRQAVTFEKALSRTFEAMVTLELIKQGKEPFYADYIDCLLPAESRAVIALPFPTAESLQVRLHTILKTANISRIEFVTMGYGYQREEEGVLIEAIPFWQWALREEG